MQYEAKRVNNNYFPNLFFKKKKEFEVSRIHLMSFSTTAI